MFEPVRSLWCRACAACRALQPAAAGGWCWRAVQPADAPALDRLVNALSAHDRRLRFHAGVNGLTPRGLLRWTEPETTHVPGFVVVSAGQLVADARLALDNSGLVAELGLLVDARWRGRGLGSWCLRRLAHEARARGARSLRAAVLAENTRMLGLLLRNGFEPVLDCDAEGHCLFERALMR